MSSAQEEPQSPSSIRVQTSGDKKPEEPSGTSSRAFATLIRYLTDESWTFSRPADHILMTHVTGKNGTYRILMDMREEKDPDEKIFLMYVTAPVKAPTEKRLVVAEYLTRANWVAVVGNFEMDFSDGEIRYKGVLEYADGTVTPLMLEQLIHKCAGTMDQYFPGLMRIIYGELDAVAAIQPIVPQQGTAGMAYALAQLVEAIGATDENDSSTSDAEEQPEVADNDGDEEEGRLDASSSTEGADPADE